MLRHLWQTGVGVIAGAATATALAVIPATPAAAATGPVSTTPASGTPRLTNTGSTQIVRQLAQCNGIMYAVGSFNTITSHGTDYTRNNIFSFSATSPFTLRSWNPNVNGVVNSIAFNGDCSTAYIGGKFTQIGGTTGVSVKNIAAISTSTGAVTTTFRHNANGQVDTLRRFNGHLLVGGYFTSINNNGGANPYLASLDVLTGSDDGFIHLSISGNYHFCSDTRCTGSNPTRVYNQQISHGGTLDLVEGDFTSVGGKSRRQIFMLNLSANPSQATVTGWTSPEWDGSNPNYPYDCWYTEPFYIRAASWSPDDSAVYIATTGYRPYNGSWSAPRTGLCDAVAAFPATQTSVLHKWINYTGCDSLYSTAADLGAVYAGGHERWSDNPNGCDRAGTGAIVDPGMEGIAPATGRTLLNSSGEALYTRSRGKGADDMLITGAGLWIASDSGTKNKSTGTFQYSNVCNHATGHAGICFLPY